MDLVLTNETAEQNLSPTEITVEDQRLLRQAAADPGLALALGELRARLRGLHWVLLHCCQRAATIQRFCQTARIQQKEVKSELGWLGYEPGRKPWTKTSFRVSGRLAGVSFVLAVD